MSNSPANCKCENPMTADKVHWFLDLFDELGIEVWIDGGWGVDALLGECTRETPRLGYYYLMERFGNTYRGTLRAWLC